MIRCMRCFSCFRICSNVVISLLNFLGRNLHANAEAESDVPVDPPKVEEKIGAVPHGLSTDSDVVKR